MQTMQAWTYILYATFTKDAEHEVQTMDMYIAMDEMNTLYLLETPKDIKKNTGWHIYLKKSQDGVAFRRQVLSFGQDTSLDIRKLKGQKVRVHADPEAKTKTPPETGAIIHIWKVEPDHSYALVF